ncbi:hypothetical protein bpr_II335 (plasmid) [Butyrivibrio proteoclasticus B316]|uniref:Uncharacterized protein n=1 Tax=Butyrivibrio proteoclasticus (strain ATCC 51982 / DSM 14932 / B316) TaxID=515622 RepID=E0S4E0_BUTPB|nr:hypothetical protein [Butyrivibrio proteoclasticus]ADL36272.1 hypothetical protein bpr_II335 [Butyrivibrio proteoclasticus B316]
MRNIKEEIRLFQDAKENKTTIIIWNMSEQTKKKLAELLLNDLQTVETVTGVESTQPDLSNAQFKNVDANTETIESFMARLPEKPAEKMTFLAKCMLGDGPEIARDVAKEVCEEALCSEDIKADDNLRGILYALREFWQDGAQKLVQNLGFANNSTLTDDKKLVEALRNADRDTLEVLVRSLMNVL